MDKKAEAIIYHDRKYNCCQAVLCAFADEVGMRKDVLFRAGEAFGRGMGGMNGTCGALSAAMLLAGLVKSDGDTVDPQSKAETYKYAAEIHDRFREMCGSTICRELKGVDTGKVLTSCPDCIRNSVKCVQEILGI